MLIRPKLPGEASDRPPEVWAEHVIGERGAEWAARALAEARDAVRAERARIEVSSRPSEYGVALDAEELGEAQAGVARAEEVAAALEEKLIEWRRLTSAFAEAFESDAVDTASVWLDESAAEVEAEASRYTDAAWGEGELASLVEHARALSEASEAVARAERELRSTTRNGGRLGDDLRRLAPGYAEKVEALSAKVRGAEFLRDVVRARAEDEHPILAVHASGSGGGDLAILARGEPHEVKAILDGTVGEKRDAIAKMRVEIEADSSLVWSLPVVVAGTRERMGIASDSVEARLLEDHLAERALDERTREVAMGLAVLGLGAASVFTLGSSGVAASGIAGKLVLGASISVNGAVAMRDLAAYRRENAAHETHFDQAQALSREEPSLFWLALSVAATGLEVGAAAGVFAKLKGPARAAMEAAPGPEGRAARAALAKELEAAKVVAPKAALESAMPIAGPAGMGRRAAHEGARVVAEAFGAEAKAMLRAMPPKHLRQFADAGVLARLSAAERGPVVALIRRGVSPRAIDEVVSLGEQLRTGTGRDLLSYLGRQPVEEVQAARAMLKLEIEHEGHAVLRHGPHLEDAVLEARLRTGLTPDGMPSHAPASTRFRSFRMMKRTHEDARRVAADALHLDFSKAPGVGGNSVLDQHVLVLDY